MPLLDRSDARSRTLLVLRVGLAARLFTSEVAIAARGRQTRSPEDPCTQSSRPAESNTASRSAPSSRSSCSTSSRARRSPSSASCSSPTATSRRSVGRSSPTPSVSAEVVNQTRGPKLISFKYRPKARSRVKKGHRQELTVAAHRRHHVRWQERRQGRQEGRATRPGPSAMRSRRPQRRRPPRTPSSPRSCAAEQAGQGRAEGDQGRAEPKAPAQGQGRAEGRRPRRPGEGRDGQDRRRRRAAPKKTTAKADAGAAEAKAAAPKKPRATKKDE